MKEKYEFDAVIEPVEEKGGAYVRVPIDLRSEFGKEVGETIHVSLVPML